MLLVLLSRLRSWRLGWLLPISVPDCCVTSCGTRAINLSLVHSLARLSIACSYCGRSRAMEMDTAFLGRSFAVTVGLVLAIASIGVLIYFIDYTSTIITGIARYLGS